MSRSSIWFLQRQVFLLVVLLSTACATAASAQCVDSSEVNGFKVYNVKFKTFLNRIPGELIELLDSHRGESYSAARASQYINEIVKFHDTNSLQQKYEQLIANKLKLSLKAGVTELQCVRKVSAEECRRTFGDTSECVSVIIARYFVEVDALNASPYLLPFPRRAMTALYGALPVPLLALNPAFDLNLDRQFGPAGRFDTVTDLLDLPQLFDRKAPATEFEQSSDDLKKRDLQLLFQVNGRKSLDQAFYDSSVRLALARRSALSSFPHLGLESTFVAQHLPQGRGETVSNRGSIGFRTDLPVNQPVINRLSFSAEYSWARNSSTAPGQAVERSTENTFTIRALADGRLANGLWRAALWTDSSILSGGGGSYRRLLSRIGYGKEIPLHRRKRLHKITPVELGQECWTAYEVEPNTNEPTLGLEVLAGAGRAWGSIPAHARFYAGGVAGQFLHDDFIAESLRATPAGPLLRSLGEAQGTVTPSDGGTSFWHANFNVAFPVPGWSRPLIPHEWVTASPLRPDDREFAGHIPPGDAVCRDLKSVIKTLVGVSGINLMVNRQARGFLTEEQQRDLRLRSVDERTAEEEARLTASEAALTSAKRRVRPEIEELFARDILPVTSFIADHANIFAVKPLVIFDVARLNDRTGGRTRWSVGGGLQLDVVLARFELGYLAAGSRAPGDAKGNFIARLVLKRFF